MFRGTNIFRASSYTSNRDGKNPTSSEHGSLTESINTLETKLEIESEQPSLTPDMLPIIRPEVWSIEMSVPHFLLNKTKLSIVIDKTQDIILEFLINTLEIYLAQKKVSQNKEKLVNSSEREVWEGSKGNKLRALYKDRKSGIESTHKQSVRKPFHYNLPKESLFYKEIIATVKKTATCVEKQPKVGKSKQLGDRKKGKIRLAGKSIR